jgi:hypothetical protein
MAARRTTIYLEDKDRRALSFLQNRYGLATLSDALRFSIRVVRDLAPHEGEHLDQLSPRNQRQIPQRLAWEKLIVRARQANHGAELILSQTQALLDKRKHLPAGA